MMQFRRPIHAVDRDVERRGAIIVVAMVAIIVSTAVSVSLIRNVLVERGLVQANECRIQADWLVEAGIERGTAALSANSEYAGEIWNPTTVELPLDGKAEIVIQVESDSKNPTRRRLTVTAKLNRSDKFQSTRQKTVLVDVSSPPETGT